MKCTACNTDMIVSMGKPRSAVGSEAVYRDLYMVCPNPKCDNYSGSEINKSKNVFLKTIPLNDEAREEVRANGGTT